MAPSSPQKAACGGAAVAALAAVVAEGAVSIPLPPQEESFLVQVVVAGRLAAVVAEEVPGAAMVGEVEVVVMERSGAAVMEEE